MAYGVTCLGSFKLGGQGVTVVYNLQLLDGTVLCKLTASNLWLLEGSGVGVKWPSAQCVVNAVMQIVAFPQTF